MLKAFFKDSAIYVVPTVFSRGLSIFLVPLYTRVLSPADYGSLDLLTVFATIVNLTIPLEVSQGLARFYPDESDADKKAALASSAFWFTVGCYTAFGVAALAFSHELSIWVMGRPGMEKAFRIGLVYVWLNGIFYLVQNQFRWELKSGGYALASLLVTVVTAAIAVFLAYGLMWGLDGLLIGMAAGAAAGTAYGLWYLRHSFRLRFDTACLRSMLLFSAPLVPSGIAVFISTYVDRLIINCYLNIDELGVYGVGFRLASAVAVVMVAFQTSLTPLVYKHYREPETPREIARIFRIFVALALMVFAGLSLFAREILVLMTTPAFYGAETVVIYLVPAILLSQMYTFAPGIFIAKKTHLILWVNVAGAFLNTGSSWLLIPRFGIAGAGLARLIGYLLVFMLYMFLNQRYYYVPHRWSNLCAASSLTFAICFLIPHLAHENTLRWAANAAAVLFFLVMIVMMGLIRREELAKLKAILLPGRS